MVDKLEDQVERVAKAMYDTTHAGLRNCYAWEDAWEDHQEPHRDRYYKEARAAIAAMNPTPTEDARERVKVLEEALLRIAETDRHTRRVKCNPNGGLRGQAGMIAVFALTGKNGSHLTDADLRTALGNKETDRHG